MNIVGIIGPHYDVTLLYKLYSSDFVQDLQKQTCDRENKPKTYNYHQWDH